MALANLLALFANFGGFYFRSGAFVSRLSYAGKGCAVLFSGIGSASDPA